MYMHIINKFSNEVLVVDELTDWLFEEGFRYVNDVPNADVCLHEIDEIQRQLSIQQHGF